MEHQKPLVPLQATTPAAPGGNPSEPIPDAPTPQVMPQDEPLGAPAQVELTHHEAMKIVRDGLSEIISDDPLLADLPSEVTTEEVGLQIALEYGQAMTVNVQKFTGEMMRESLRQILCYSLGY